MKLVAVVAALACACGSKHDGGAAGSAAAKPTEKPSGLELPPQVRIPEVTGTLPPAPTAGTPVFVTPTGIVIDGKAIVAVHEGNVDPSEKEGGALGRKINRVSRFADTMFTLETHEGRAHGPILLAFDPTTPYELVIDIIFSLKPYRDYVLLAREGGRVVGAPLRLPEKQAIALAQPGSPPPPPPSLGLAVAVTKDAILLWSISGLEGTLQAPKLKLARQDFAGLTTALADIARRRFAGKTRSDDDKQIILMCDAQIAAQDLLSLVAAVRAAPDGTELFPDVRLSSGFE